MPGLHCSAVLAALEAPNVAELLASLDDGGTSEDSEELDAIWAAEMSRRSQKPASGEVRAETWDHVLRRVAEGRHTR